MTAVELKAEFAYRKAEREAILADGVTPTLSQQYTAELEAGAGLAAANGSELWAVVLTICHEHGLGQFIANTTKPYRVPDARTAHNALGTLRNKVVVADKATLMANGFDLCEEDFAEPLELPIQNEKLSRPAAE